MTPRDGRPALADARANDLGHRQTAVIVGDAESALRASRAGACAMLSPSVVTPAEPTLGFVRGVLLRDPDGHVLQIVQP